MCLGVYSIKGEGPRILVEVCCKKAVFVFHIPLGWSVYLKSRLKIWIEQRFSHLPLDEEKPERSSAYMGVRRAMQKG